MKRVLALLTHGAAGYYSCPSSGSAGSEKANQENMERMSGQSHHFLYCIKKENSCVMCTICTEGLTSQVRSLINLPLKSPCRQHAQIEEPHPLVLSFHRFLPSLPPGQGSCLLAVEAVSVPRLHVTHHAASTLPASPVQQLAGFTHVAAWAVTCSLLLLYCVPPTRYNLFAYIWFMDIWVVL